MSALTRGGNLVMANGNGSPCDQLEAYFDGELAPEDAERCTRHIEICARCRTALAKLEALRSALAAAVTRTLPDQADLRIRRTLSSAQHSGQAFGEVLDLEDVARLLGVPVPEVVAILDTLPSFEVAGRIRFRKDRIQEWIRTREQKMAREKTRPLPKHGNGLILFPGGKS